MTLSNRYKVVILPSVERIPLDSLKKLEEFARGGGSLIATRRMPHEAPGFPAKDSDHRQIVELSRRIFEGSASPGHFVKDETSELSGKLKNLLRPDVALSPAISEIGFVHRTTSDTEIYFIANTSNSRQRIKAAFRVSGLQPEWWEAMTGNVAPADVESQSESGTTVFLNLLQLREETVVVANTAINYLAGRRLPDYKLLNLRYGERFQPQDMDNLQPIPSGLLGTIRLIAQ
jgi:hypothetical protein